MKYFLIIFLLALINTKSGAQKADPLHPDFTTPRNIPGMSLVWNDEFNITGKPDPANWKYENGFARNQELQWYQPDNANCANGVLTITGRKQKVKNPGYIEGSSDWRKAATVLIIRQAACKLGDYNSGNLVALKSGRVSTRLRAPGLLFGR